MSYFKSILLGLISDIITEYEGKEIQDKYGFNKFESSTWYVKSDEESEYKKMNYKNMDIYDLSGEIDSLMEGIIKSNENIIVSMKIKNTNII